ncbi:MAG: hypothetical protein WAU89_23480 [Candidatus Acidiferrales bacterium]
MDIIVQEPANPLSTVPAQHDLFSWKPPVRFNGAEYDPALDNDRLESQMGRVFEAMRDGRWRTLGELTAITRDPEASVSAQLRHLRKERFGSYTVQRQARGDRVSGLYEYRLLSPTGEVIA